MGVFLANALHHVSQVGLSVLRDSRKCGHRLRLILHLGVLAAPHSLSRVVSILCAWPQTLPRAVVLIRWLLPRHSPHCPATLRQCLVGRRNSVCPILLLHASLVRGLSQIIILGATRRALGVVHQVLRTDHSVRVCCLTRSSLRLALNVGLGTQPFRLYVTVAIFQILLLGLLVTTLMWTAVQSHFRCRLAHWHDLEGLRLVASRALPRRIHAHFKLSRYLEGSDFANPC